MQIRSPDGSVAVGLFLYVFVPLWLIENGKEACNALPGFMPTLIGGQRDDIQFCKQASFCFYFFKSRVLLLKPDQNASRFRWILACAVLGSSSLSRNEPERDVCHTYFQSGPNTLIVSTSQLGYFDRLGFPPRCSRSYALSQYPNYRRSTPWVCGVPHEERKSDPRGSPQIDGQTFFN